MVPDSANEGPPRKLQKINVEGDRSPKRASSSPIDITSQSSFTFKNHMPASSPDDFMLDITKYIPAGCLRVKIPGGKIGINAADWNACKHWSALPHKKDIHHYCGGPYLSKELQSAFFNNSTLKPFLGLHLAGWIRLEFKSNDSSRGQIRVYILPDDVGRATVDRSAPSLRKALQSLIAQLDISPLTWNGDWFEKSPIYHVDPSLDKDSRPAPSLFRLFNDLPSPKPTPELVADKYVRDAMFQLLNSEVPGLKTTMHNYQCRTAAMMLQRESQPGQVIDPRIAPLVDQKGITWYCDTDIGHCFRDPRTFEAPRGGICAETMGLGKTLICLALILATRDLSSHIPEEYSLSSITVRKTTGSLLDMAAAKLGRSGIPWKNDLSLLESAEGYTFDRCREAIRKGAGYYFLPGPAPRRFSRHVTDIPARKLWLSTTTIVVCPSNLVQQWRSEIKKHTVGLTVLYMTSTKVKLPPAEELPQYDIILFSKMRFEKQAKDMWRGKVSTNKEGDKEEHFSPLNSFHFKRLIVDEGHAFGNTTGAGKSMAASVVDSLQLSARWIISGTPTKGLYGAEVAIGRSSLRNPACSLADEQHENGSNVADELAESPDDVEPEEHEVPDAYYQHGLFLQQERKDLEKLGNIATHFLKALPWANHADDEDHASWSQLVMQPRHGSKSRGSTHCLRAALEAMIIRHRPKDISQDIKLPALHQKVVYLEGSIQNKLSLNTFSLMVVSNAVTSERKDADYFFHPKQRKNLQQLVSNLRQASFFWSGFEAEHVRSTIDNAKKFLEDKKVPVTLADEALLRQAIVMGEAVLANDISQAISKWHEMPMYIQNILSDDIRSAWSLIGASSNPTLIGATMVHAAQKFVHARLSKSDPTEGLAAAGREAMKAALATQEPTPSTRATVQKKRKDSKKSESAPVLAGGVTVGDEASPRKRARAPSLSTTKMTGESEADAAKSDNKMAMKIQYECVKTPTLDSGLQLASAQLISTASAKLSYLMDRILLHQDKEKILVFYEAGNVAWYIAQALECLSIEHRIYAKSLKSDQRSRYVVEFNQDEKIRVLLMDVSQAAFGLDMSAASRVYFVNPVFSPQVEAQAVKRAHRIGQMKPVYVETLVLRGSIEEVILKRREDMTNEEHNKCKNILDDTTMYDWIRNVRFQPIPSDPVPGPEQMTILQFPQLVFCRRAGKPIDPVASLPVEVATDIGKGKGESIVEDERPTSSSESHTTKVRHRLLDDDTDLEYLFNPVEDGDVLLKMKRKRKEGEEAPEKVFEPLQIPQASTSANNVEDEDWEVPAWADSDSELDI